MGLNENITYQNWGDTAEAIPKGQFVALLSFEMRASLKSII